MVVLISSVYVSFTNFNHYVKLNNNTVIINLLIFFFFAEKRVFTQHNSNVNYKTIIIMKSFFFDNIAVFLFFRVLYLSELKLVIPIKTFKNINFQKQLKLQDN